MHDAGSVPSCKIGSVSNLISNRQRFYSLKKGKNYTELRRRLNPLLLRIFNVIHFCLVFFFFV